MLRRAPLPLLAALSAVVVALVVGGVTLLLTRPLQVSAPPGAGDPACARLAAQLPDQVGALQRRATSSDSPGVAAWGDPAIIWLCGVAEPGPSADCLDVSGVDWIFVPLGDADDGVAFTSVGRTPAVQVLVPHAYEPEPLQLPAFSDVIAPLPQGPRRCSD